MENVMNEEPQKSEPENESATSASAEPSKADAPKRRGRPKGSTMATTAPKRRGRPPKSAAGTRRGRRPKTAVGLVEQFEQEIEARYQAKLDAAQAQIVTLKAEVKAAQKREKAALKLFERQEKALNTFVTKWNSKELAKVQKSVAKINAKNVGSAGRRRGRPPKVKTAQ